MSKTKHNFMSTNVKMTSKASNSKLYYQDSKIIFLFLISVFIKFLGHIITSFVHQLMSLFRGVDPSSEFFIMIWWCVSGTCTLVQECTHRGVSEGMCLPQKLENFVFLRLESWNLVNTFRCKFRAGDE